MAKNSSSKNKTKNQTSNKQTKNSAKNCMKSDVTDTTKSCKDSQDCMSMKDCN